MSMHGVFFTVLRNPEKMLNFIIEHSGACADETTGSMCKYCPLVTHCRYLPSHKIKHTMAIAIRDNDTDTMFSLLL